MNTFKILTIIMLTGIIFSANSQNKKLIKQDSSKQKTILSIKEKFPRSRILNFEYGQSLTRNYNAELLNQDFHGGKVKAQHTFNASANIPLAKTRKWSLTGSMNYQFNEFDIETESSSNFSFATYSENNVKKFHNFSSSLSSTYFSMLFKKPVIYNASLIIDGNDKGFERLKGLIGLSFIMKRTARTTITLGAISFIDPTSQIPFFPTFSFNHKFKNSKWEVDFIMPQRLLFRSFVGENGRFSIGSSFGTSGFYVNINEPNFAEMYEYSQLEIKSGIMYEYRISNYLIGTFQAGLQNFISNRLTEKGEPTKDYIYKNNQDATGYFQFGISIDPFVKRKK